MKFIASQIAALLSGTIEGDPNAEVWNVAKIEEGAPGMLSFLANPKYTPYLYTTKSSVVIVRSGVGSSAHAGNAAAGSSDRTIARVSRTDTNLRFFFISCILPML